MNTRGVDAFRFAKELGKHKYLGEIEVLSYMDLSNRIKKNKNLILKIQEKKRKAQASYEQKVSKITEI
jgi:hypothetical protein